MRVSIAFETIDELTACLERIVADDELELIPQGLEKCRFDPEYAPNGPGQFVGYRDLQLGARFRSGETRGTGPGPTCHRDTAPLAGLRGHQEGTRDCRVARPQQMWRTGGWGAATGRACPVATWYAASTAPTFTFLFVPRFSSNNVLNSQLHPPEVHPPDIHPSNAPVAISAKPPSPSNRPPAPSAIVPTTLPIFPKTSPTAFAAPLMAPEPRRPRRLPRHRRRSCRRRPRRPRPRSTPRRPPRPRRLRRHRATRPTERRRRSSGRRPSRSRRRPPGRRRRPRSPRGPSLVRPRVVPAARGPPPRLRGPWPRCPDSTAPGWARRK